jgi:DNA-directed RNA polymerase subunit RPC12/RpoP
MKYMLLCNICGNKLFTDGKDLSGLSEVATAPTPKRGDGKSKETINQKKKLKCPQCGYLLHIVKLTPEKPKEDEDDKKEPPAILF